MFSIAAVFTLMIGSTMFSHLTRILHAQAAIGQAMPVGDLPGWKQTGAQGFDKPAGLGLVGEVYGPAMRGYSDFEDSSGRGIYAPDSVLSVADGKLDYFLHTDHGAPSVASVVPFGYGGQTYGRYSIKFRSDSLPGYKIAFMLWPVSDDWADGEVDWPEGGLDGMPYGASAIRGSQDEFRMMFDPLVRTFAPSDMKQWHIATTEWTPARVRWFWDGELVDETDLPSAVPITPMRWTLQAETSVGPGTSAPAPGTAGHLEIDWVVQYAYAP
ncbi:glycoside hydrolase family 16 protein [Sinomonas sp. JGH33]|uniref:Glycoside hydrolase family 16 protein n=1 Tax=Sinomonas terricola TaxID=3110330 RepID=A0ABU5TAI2_9MICC|nr:glycoside hydrolase family 16 protein [Sinomonas sp. JGH33]MEA5456669.1 glycoside hydrolase family 16 protein [Sinomonas sp. JGH33]